MQSSGAGARAFQNARLQKKLKKQADAIISTANAAYGQGRYAETEALCRQILNELPEHFGALLTVEADRIIGLEKAAQPTQASFKPGKRGKVMASRLQFRPARL